MGRAEGGGPGRGPPPLLLLLGVTLVLASGAAPGRYRPRPGPQQLSRPTLGQGPVGFGCKRCPRALPRGRGSVLPAARAGEGAHEEMRGLAGGDSAAATRVWRQRCWLGVGLLGRGLRVRFRGGTWRAAAAGAGRCPSSNARAVADAPPLSLPPTVPEAGSAVEADTPVKSVLAWEPRANDTREKAGPPAAGKDETSRTAPGGEQALVGPGVGAEEALEASAAVTGTAWLEAESPGLGGVTAEAGSGDTQALPATLPTPDEALGPSSTSAATFEATEAREPPSPTPGDKPSPGPELPKESPMEVWLNLGGSTPDPHGPEPTYPFQGTLEPHPASDTIDIDYFEGLDGEGRGADLGSFPGSPGTSEHHPDPGGETPSWSLLDLYDDFTPFDESDFYPTTSFYDDLDEEEEEEEDRDAVGGGDLEDENDLLVPTEKPGLGPGTGQPTSRWHAVPPQHTLGMVPGSSIALRPRPGEPGRDLAPSENGTVCRSGFVRHNGSCRSVCDLFPSYCHNGGQCYLVENIGAFCRCNTQDYIWHKGMRCESIITDFQVMCVAVGSAALVLLLLFMMTVFFAKKLYLLKTENTKLRRTNKFRTPSELHNDNFSLSTIAEGSHPNKSELVIVKVLCTDSEDSYHLMMKWSPGRCFSHRSDC
ncbi:chondroitin sulfate proteoglycan 5 [Oryx dammah]|uniref:chondroitin sulfate proteoglycan 5 n=1 Tax=Oryx dammah TaxID=59534 RepID=UPI001A9B1630|nr:chondroitin sulfate proteoglycan 5 [Oryx dammah]